MTQQPPLQPIPVGAFRFNTDTSKLEYYDGNQWVNITSTSPEAQTGGTRGFIAGGYANAPVAAYGDISYFNVSTTGNSLDFGDTLATGGRTASGSSRTRGITFYANAPAKDTIEYIEISTLGNAVDFGNLLNLEDSNAATSDATRTVVAGGYPNNPDGSSGAGPYTRTNVIQYITTATTGNAVDYGDLAVARSDFDGCSSPTRGIFGGGGTTPSAGDRGNVIDYITIQTTGNSADFGDLTVARSHLDAGSNAIRGIFVQGINTTPSTTPVNTLDYVTIASLGNAVEFGDATVSVYGRAISTSPTRLVAACGSSGSADFEEIDYVQIMTTGNAIDFGDCDFPATGLEGPVGFSNGHGGLG